MRKISSVMTLILVVCLTIGGVSASWIYAAGSVADIFKDLFVSMSEWEFGYTVSFINNNQNLIDPITVTDNSKEFVIMNTDVTGIDNVVNADAKIAAEAADAWVKANEGSNYTFSHWINAGSTRIDSIPAGNLDDVKLYPSFVGVYTAMFVDQKGNVLAWDTFTNNAYNNITILANQTTPPAVEDCEFDYWQVQTKANDGTIIKTKISDFNFKNIDRDITIYPVYTFNGDANLIPVDTDGDGEPNYYEVGGYSNTTGQDLVKIPDKINGVNITTINANAFSGYANVHVVVLPKYVELVGDNAISDATVGGFLGMSAGETVTLYYSGSKADWLEREKGFDNKWDYGMSADSRIFFLNGGDKVDPTQGYLQAEPQKSGSIIQTQNGVEWTEHTIDQDYISNMYTAKCTGCDSLPHANGITLIENHTHEFTNGVCENGCDVTDPNDVYNRRPDYIYWGTEDGSTAITLTTN